MDTVDIRQTIASAKQKERLTGHLAQHFRMKAQHLHSAIDLPAENAIPALLNFTIRYIDHVPEFVEAILEIAGESDLSTYTDPVVRVISETFIDPPDLLDGQEGLAALLDEAYLAHRLIEEINDRFMASCGKALVPMDMTRSNLIVHHLIGEPFANQLDGAVKIIVDSLEMHEAVFSASSLAEFRDSPFLAQATADLSQWPCLADNLAVNLSFGKFARIDIH